MPCAIGWKDGARCLGKTIAISNTVGWILGDGCIDFSAQMDSDMGLRV
jgi:hypothetical protein